MRSGGMDLIECRAAPNTGMRVMERAAGGDTAAWGTLLSDEAERLTRVVMFRLDRRLAGGWIRRTWFKRLTPSPRRTAPTSSG